VERVRRNYFWESNGKLFSSEIYFHHFRKVCLLKTIFV
jgi:hypothetical protein